MISADGQQVFVIESNLLLVGNDVTVDKSPLIGPRVVRLPHGAIGDGVDILSQLEMQTRHLCS